MLACEGGSLEVASYLIEVFEMDPRAKDTTGWNSLMIACYNQHIALVQYLI